MEDITNLDAQVTNTIERGENKRKMSTTSIYLKPTTMRGIPLASLIPSPAMRGFYITKSEDDLPSSSTILTDSSTPSLYTTTNTPVEQQTETTLISDISTTDETVTVTHNDQIKLKPNTFDDVVNDKGIDNREEKYSTSSSSEIFSKDSSENLLPHETSNLITIPIGKPTSKRGKSLHNFDHTTPLSNSYVSSTTPTRRRIALAVSRYNEATTPLWTGRRIIVKKRNRTTVSPIKDAIKRTKSDSILTSSSLIAKSASTLITKRRKVPTTSTIPTISSIMFDSAPSPEILNVHNNFANFNDTKTEDPESHATIEVAMTNSIITATPSNSKIIPTTNDPTTADFSTFSDDPTTMTDSAVAKASITIDASPSMIKTLAAITDTTITTTSAITSIGETTSLNYFVTDNPLENTNAIPTDIADTIVFATSTEIPSTNVNVPETEQTVATESITKSTVANTEMEQFATEPVTKSTVANTEMEQFATEPITKSTVANTEMETTSTMINYSTLTVPDTVNPQEIAIDSANTTTTQIINDDIDDTSTIANYSAITNPTTINMHDVTTDIISITTASTEVETTSMIGNYSTFTTTVIKNITIPVTTTSSVTTTASPITTVISSTASTEVETTSMIGNYSTFTTTVIKNITIPVTTTSSVTTTASPITTVISSTVDTQHIPAIAPITTSNPVDPNTTNITTPTTIPLGVLIPTITDLNVITTSASANIPSTPISETSPVMIQSSSDTSSKAPITVVTSTSAALTNLTTEFSTIHLTNKNNIDISNNSDEIAVTTTTESTQTTEIPTTFEIPPTLIATTFPKSLHSTNFEASSIVTAALSTQGDKSSISSKVTQTPSTPLSITTLITNKATVDLERSTASATLSAIFGESITTNPTIRSMSAYDADFVRTTSEESTIPERKIGFKEATSTEIQSQIEDQITTTNKPSSVRTTSKESITPEMKIMFEGVASKAVENLKQNQTTSEPDTTNYQFSQKTARRRVLNRTNNWLGNPVTLQRTNQYPQHRVTLHRERLRRPSTISSSKIIEKNSRRRINQKRFRVNSEAFNSTVGSDQDSVDVQNTTKDHVAYDRMENVRKMKVMLKKRVGEEMSTILPIEETTVFLQSSTAIKNKTVHDNGNIEEKQKITPKKIKIPQESFATTETSTNSSSNESLPDTQSNFNMAENLSDLEKSSKIMKIVLKNVRSQSEEKNPIQEVSADTKSINTKLQDNFPKNSYTDKNFSDHRKRITGRRTRVVLKSVRPKAEEKNSIIEKTNVEFNSTDKNLLQNNLSNNININQNFSNKEKTRRRMRVVQRVKPKSEEGVSKAEETSSEYDFTNESLQGTFSNNFYSAKNLPVEYETRRKMRVVLKSVKPKSEEKNSTIEETTINPDSINENLRDTFSGNFRNGKNVEYRSRRRMRVILKSVNLKSEKENSTVEETTVNPDSINKNFQSIFLNNFRRGKNLPVEFETKTRTKVILKSIKPKSEERNSTIEDTSVYSDSTNKDLQGSFSSNLHMNESLSDKEDSRRKTVVLKSLKSEVKETDTVAEETSADFVEKDPQVLYTFHFSSNFHVDDNLSDKKKKHSISEEKAMTERPEDMEPQTTRTSVLVEEDTDRRPSLEVTNSGLVNRNSGNGYFNRHRKPTSFTTIAPLTNSLSNTLAVHRRSRPVETTLSPRIDFIGAFEDSDSYVKPIAILHDQNADVSDQSIRAQEFAVTLSDPPSSSSDIGRMPLKDVDRRKISTTITPRTDSTSRTVSRYDANFQSRQRSRPKEKPTVNATTRPRRPPVIDYDYYEDEVPIIVDKSILNSKLFLTSKGTIRCLDQGNFPHPYSCKKFITCARMVNGQVIGTEYTCPEKLTFDPIGGICNWSAGLGCKG